MLITLKRIDVGLKKVKYINNFIISAHGSSMAPENMKIKFLSEEKRKIV